MAKPRYKWSDFEVKLILGLYREGKTDLEIAKILGIPETTFTDRLKYNKLTEAIKKAKDVPDDEMERSLYQRGKGFFEVEEERVETDIVNGQPIIRKVIKTKRTVLPDTAAAFIWLKNRRPEKWRDKHEYDIKEIPVLLDFRPARLMQSDQKKLKNGEVNDK